MRYRKQFKKTDLEAIKTLAERNQFEVIELHNNITLDISGIVKVKDDIIYNFDEIQDIELSDIQLLIRAVKNDLSDVFEEENYIGWTHEESKKREFICETTILNQTVSINSGSQYEKWYLSTPNHFDPPDLDTSRKESYTTAKTIIYIYISQISGYKLDYIKTLREVARDKFRELPGIGEAKSNKIISEEIYSYEELQDAYLHFVNRNHKDKIKRIAGDLAGTEEEPRKHPKVQQIKEQAVLDDL